MLNAVEGLGVFFTLLPTPDSLLTAFTEEPPRFTEGTDEKRKKIHLSFCRKDGSIHGLSPSVVIITKSIVSPRHRIPVEERPVNACKKW